MPRNTHNERPDGERRKPSSGSRSNTSRPARPERPSSAGRPQRTGKPGAFKKSFGGGDKRKKYGEGGDEERPRYGKTTGKRFTERGGDRESKRDAYKKPFGKPGASAASSRASAKPAGRGYGDERPKRPAREGGEEGGDKKRYSGKFERKSFVQSRLQKQRKRGPSKKESQANVNPELIRLNKFISNSGVCSRREADELIKMGLVTVNGQTITEMGYKVKLTDEVRYEGKKLKAEKPVYILVNKPKGYITTTDDPQDRNTVMHLIADACKERVYPVGRLDRNTTGLLLLTNDGDLADKLTHPSYNVKKIYKVELDRPITKADFDKIAEGVHLEEGKAVPDDLAIVSDDNKTIGIELHIGWNRIVRRIFEALQYEVVKLDRVVYAGLDKKNLGRGEWRFLKPEEVIRLKHLQ